MTSFGQDVGTRAGEIEAVRAFIMGATPVNDEAALLRDDFIKRWDDLSWFDTSFPSQALYDEIKNRENQFWIVNRSQAERASAARVVINNPTDPRQLSGGAFPEDERLRHIDNPNIENLQAQIDKEAKKFHLPSWFGTAAIVTGLVGVGLGIAKVVSGLNPVALISKIRS